MSTFAVTKETIGEILPHPNADRLEIARLEGVDFQVVVPKGVYNKNERVIYFPIDAVLPVKLSDHIGITKYLSNGKIRTAKLRGEISQGVITKCNMVYNYTGRDSDEFCWGHDYAPLLGVTKYEPPERFCPSGRLLPLPEQLSVYDLENCEKLPNTIEAMMDQPVWISEKIEGTNSAVFYDGMIKVCQRTASIEEEEGKVNTYWEAARTSGLIEKVKAIPVIAGSPSIRRWLGQAYRGTTMS